MKPSSVRFVPLFGLMALSIVLALVGCVDAYEDPAENEWRSRQANLLWFRTQYRKHYVLDLDRYPEPEERLILKTYPARVTQIAEALQHYGTRSWNSNDNVLEMLSKLDSAIKFMLINCFHPKLIENQPDFVRKKHEDTFQELVNWLHVHHSQLVELQGPREATKRLELYRSVRDLAIMGMLVPRR